jgi:hypothetical protein
MAKPENTGNRLFIDATAQVPAPQAGHLNLGGADPAGREITITSRWLALEGQPWFPVMGEFQYSRYPEKFWEDELLKIKAAGITIISSYAFWIHHEEREGEFNWKGNRDIRRFVQLAQKHGFLFWLRPGPWVHGECRNGGFPDWLTGRCGKENISSPRQAWSHARGHGVRRNDPAYLEFSARYFRELGRELRGLSWKDGGPLIGIQLENEYMLKGPDAGAVHILKLKELARSAGLDAPLWSVTGWGDPEYPEREVFATFGMYPDHFWDGGMLDMEQDNRAMFVQERNDPTIGADLTGAMKVDGDKIQQCLYPYTTCEMGGGIQVSYRRRPLILAEQAVAMNMTRVGSGVKLQGYYVFHGGVNPIGVDSPMHESQATGYWSDCPVLSYDFQAPISEFGQVREVAHGLRPMHLLLRDFGLEMARTEAMFPEVQPADWKDTGVLRACARMDGDSGFLFVNNYQRFLPLPERMDAQVEIAAGKGRYLVPDFPVTIPSGSSFIWPVNMDIAGVLLKYSTAQPLCRVEDGGVPVYFFAVIGGIEPEFVFDESTVRAVNTDAEATVEDGIIRVRGVKAGTAPAMTLETSGGKRVTVVVLESGQARHCYRARVQGVERVLLTNADPLIEDSRIRLRSRDHQGLELGVFPAIKGEVSCAGSPLVPSRDGVFARYSAKVAPVEIGITVDKTAEAGPSVPPRLGSQRQIEAPEETDFARAASWKVGFAGKAPAYVSEIFLGIDYVGDVARLYSGGRFVADDFYYGRLWEPGLRRMGKDCLEKGLELKVLPLRKDSQIYMDSTARPRFDGKGEAVRLGGIRAFPEYEVELEVGGGRRLIEQ